jgi:hypothetical protein
MHTNYLPIVRQGKIYHIVFGESIGGNRQTSLREFVFYDHNGENTDQRRSVNGLNTGPRIVCEKKTVEQMIQIACRGKHGTREELCASCEQLLSYAQTRLSYCRFGENKTTCGACPIHCYKPDKRTEIRAVMRYAGPRMLFHHPFTLLQHTLHGIRSRKK